MSLSKKHNRVIGFWKFAFCILIIALHVSYYNQNGNYLFAGGSIAVDFFFIVSGYLFCKKCINYNKVNNNELAKENVINISSVIKKFLPYFVILWVLSMPYLIFVRHYGMSQFVYSIFKVLFFPAKSTNTDSIFGIGWYITTLVVVYYMMFPLLVKYRRSFVYYFCPLIVFFLGGYLSIRYGVLAEPWRASIIAYKGILRGLFDINIGMILYVIYERFVKLSLSNLAKLLLTFVEFGGYLSIFYIVNMDHAHSRFDFFMILLLSVSILISFSNQSYSHKLFNYRIVDYLEKYSLTMYLNQFLIIQSLVAMFNFYKIEISYYFMVFIVTILSIALSFICETLLIPLYDSVVKFLKKIMLTS